MLFHFAWIKKNFQQSTGNLVTEQTYNFQVRNKEKNLK
jgi:hypothetical protein